MNKPIDDLIDTLEKLKNAYLKCSEKDEDRKNFDDLAKNTKIKFNNDMKSVLRSCNKRIKWLDLETKDIEFYKNLSNGVYNPPYTDAIIYIIKEYLYNRLEFTLVDDRDNPVSMQLPEGFEKLKKLADIMSSMSVPLFISWCKESLNIQQLEAVRNSTLTIIIKIEMLDATSCDSMPETLNKATHYFSPELEPLSETDPLYEEFKAYLLKYLFAQEPETNEEKLQKRKKLFLKLMKKTAAAYFQSINFVNLDTLKYLKTAGNLAFQKLEKEKLYKNMSKNMKKEFNRISNKNVSLEPSLIKHNIFKCPVIKDEVDPAEKIVALDCGHLVSCSTIDELFLAASSRRNAKCPTCNADFFPDKTTLVKF